MCVGTSCQIGLLTTLWYKNILKASLFRVIFATVEPLLRSFSKNIMLICYRLHECLITSYFKWYSCNENPSNLPFLLHARLLIHPPPPVDIPPNFCLPQHVRPRCGTQTHPPLCSPRAAAAANLTCAGCCCDFGTLCGQVLFLLRRQKKPQTNWCLIFCQKPAR